MSATTARKHKDATAAALNTAAEDNVTIPAVAEDNAAATVPVAPEETVASNGAAPDDAAPDGATPPTRTITVGKESDGTVPVDVVIPVRWTPGMVMDEYTATCVQLYHERQFVSTHNANAKNRAAAFAKATTDKEREANKPWSAEEYAKAFASYQVSHRGKPSLSALETLRQETAETLYAEIVNAHNAAIAAGQPGILKITGPAKVNRPLTAKQAKDKGLTPEQHAADTAAVEAANTKIIAALCASTKHGPIIEARVQAELAARKAKAEAAKAAGSGAVATVVNVDMFD